MTTATSNILEAIKEAYVSEEDKQYLSDLYDVAQALLSVEDKLDWDMKYSLERLLQRYVIELARQDPEGLKSILSRFPLETGNSEGSQESIVKSAVNLSEAISTIPDCPDSVRNSVSKLVESTIRTSISSSGSDNESQEKFRERVKGLSLPANIKDNFDTLFPGNAKQSDSNVPPVIKESEIPKNIEGLEEFRCNSVVNKLSSDDGSVWRVRLIQSGFTLSGRYFPDNVLKESMPLFENARCYVNHPPEDYQGGDRPLQTFVGWYDNITLKEADGLYADWHILANSGTPWLKDQLIELSKSNKLDLVGLSLLGLGKNTFKRVEGKLVKCAESIQYVRSVDLVDVPGAGGKVVESIKESDDAKVRRELMKLEEMTVEQLKEARPDLFEEIRQANKPKADTDKPKDDDAPGSDTSDQMMEVLNRMQIRESNMILGDKLRESKLPQPMKDALTKQFKDKVFDEADLDAQIDVYRESAAALSPYGGEEPKFHLPAAAHMITSEERMQVAVDRLFGLEVDEKYSDVPKLSGIREAYLMMTGDFDFSWGAISLDERFREALPSATKVVGGGTITFANVLGTSMNRRLVRQYKRQPMWWEPVVNKIPLANLKQQDRNRLNSFGSLTERTTGGAEYTELTWSENVETYTPTEYGNIVPIAQKAVVNDDLGALTRASDEMGRSAGITLNEYVSNLFTQNSGEGPALADGNNVFDASNHQGNLVATALNRTNYSALDKVIRKMTDASSKRIGLYIEYLLVPPDLREAALQLERSQMVPDSANRAVNVFSGEFKTIVVPNWTDTDNWYVMAGPAQADLIEMGFLNGREEPEMFVQADPTVGMSFTHDVIAYKVRHRYGGGWVDYRGAAASVV